MSSPAQWTLTETRDRLASRGVSSREVVESVLTAIERRNRELNAYVLVNAEAAMEEARAADERRARGEISPLLGVPIGVKDNIAVRGELCTCASRILQGYRSPYDSTVAARLRAAGAILLGRLNLDEFAMGSSTETSVYGPVRNPWSAEHVAGGSSGGSAAAVAADLAIAALGSDTGGSIRQPASFCGCVGLKPTYGRVSRYGLVAYASSLDQIGPLTKSVRDAALLLDVIAGRDPRDSTTLDVPGLAAESALMRVGAEDLRGLRIGVPEEYFVAGLDPEVERLTRAALRRATELGAEAVEIRLPHTRYAVAAYYLIATAEASANLARYDGVRYGLRVAADGILDMYGRTRAAGFGLEVKRRIILGTHALSAGYYDQYYLRAQKVRTLIRADFAAAFERCDVIAGPVAPTPAFRLGENLDDPLKMCLSDVYTVPVNLAGICALSVPVGRTAAGLPVGLQLIGPAMREPTLLRAALGFERERERPS